MSSLDEKPAKGPGPGTSPPPAAPEQPGERPLRRSPLRKLLGRPEPGPVVGTASTKSIAGRDGFRCARAVFAPSFTGGGVMTAGTQGVTRQETMPARIPLVELDDVGKYYGNVRVLEGVSLEVHAGAISCVLGDNGAVMELGSPREALDLGIATVHQDLAVVALMPVWRNVFPGSEPTKGAVPSRARRQAVGRRPEGPRRGTGRRAGSDLDYPPPAPRLSGGRPFRTPEPRQDVRRSYPPGHHCRRPHSPDGRGRRARRPPPRTGKSVRSGPDCPKHAVDVSAIRLD